MRDYFPEKSRRTQLDLPENSSVGDLADALGAPRRLVFAVLVDGHQADIDSRLHDGAEVTLMPPFAGGRL